ncbi:hypothetical protein [Flavobacterium subsaxonicum]|uniref:Repressor n=1 Tax=Flavobacterium subsaxonicum WB 4.1-42 = DSM 21790 TaxID=1121898 RepID=A0A0A2MPL4_9FLAO|nr:hypothetical protein [Flavobacterium subsaxonicum]KGO93423.1 repressor [Flavobacterium subsaxonicum WB 4.1-42 = DSM 21790]
MANITLNNSSLKRYIDLLSNLDLTSKKKIIMGLTESIEEPKEINSIASLFGAWEDSRDSDEIIRDIKESRVNNRDIENF